MPRRVMPCVARAATELLVFIFSQMSWSLLTQRLAINQDCQFVLTPRTRSLITTTRPEQVPAFHCQHSKVTAGIGKCSRVGRCCLFLPTRA
jgi:hypothetical protein